MSLPTTKQHYTVPLLLSPVLTVADSTPPLTTATARTLLGLCCPRVTVRAAGAAAAAAAAGCSRNPNPGQRPHALRPVRARQFPPHRSHINNRSDKPSHVSPEGLGPNLEPLPRAAAQAQTEDRTAPPINYEEHILILNHLSQLQLISFLSPPTPHTHSHTHTYIHINTEHSPPHSYAFHSISHPDMSDVGSLVALLPHESEDTEEDPETHATAREFVDCNPHVSVNLPLLLLTAANPVD